MTPIEKNVRVVDEQGHEYEATYIKRAKGLVKNGRARFIDERTICLACPPNKILEDKIMNENIEIINEEIQNAEEEINAAPDKKKYTLDYALMQLEKIQSNLQTLTEKTIDEIKQIDFERPGGNTRAESITSIATGYQKTSDKLIEFYTEIIDKLSVSKTDAAVKNAELRQNKKDFLNFVLECVNAAEEGQALPNFESLWKTMYS